MHPARHYPSKTAIRRAITDLRGYWTLRRLDNKLNQDIHRELTRTRRLLSIEEPSHADRAHAWSTLAIFHDWLEKTQAMPEPAMELSKSDDIELGLAIKLQNRVRLLKQLRKEAQWASSDLEAHYRVAAIS